MLEQKLCPLVIFQKNNSFFWFTGFWNTFFLLSWGLKLSWNVFLNMHSRSTFCVTDQWEGPLRISDFLGFLSVSKSEFVWPLFQGNLNFEYSKLCVVFGQLRCRLLILKEMSFLLNFKKDLLTNTQAGYKHPAHMPLQK